LKKWLIYHSRNPTKIGILIRRTQIPHNMSVLKFNVNYFRGKMIVSKKIYFDFTSKILKNYIHGKMRYLPFADREKNWHVNSLYTYTT
jgi:hypothetical protein